MFGHAFSLVCATAAIVWRGHPLACGDMLRGLRHILDRLRFIYPCNLQHPTSAGLIQRKEGFTVAR